MSGGLTDDMSKEQTEGSKSRERRAGTHGRLTVWQMEEPGIVPKLFLGEQNGSGQTGSALQGKGEDSNSHLQFRSEWGLVILDDRK